MLTKRKATKKSLDELRKIMPVLSEKRQQEYVGGHDCWWRAVAYLKSGGTNYSAAIAFDLRNRYEEHFFPLSNSSGTIGYPSCFQVFAVTHITGGLFGMNHRPSGTIITFQPTQVSGTLGGMSGISHSVVYRGTHNGRIYFYCPQNRTTGSMCEHSFNDANSNFNFRTFIL